MSRERLETSLARFTAEVGRATTSAPAQSWGLSAQRTEQLLESMLLARHLDVLAHQLRSEGLGHYTICSAGHEANVVLGWLTRPTDPSMLHYRSAALVLERARQVAEVDAVVDIALSLVAAAAEPLCFGRHKVFGNHRLGIIPQTSTIASHLPRAVGLALALERRPRLKLEQRFPGDAVTLASFGDASLNHSTAQGALNASSWVVHQRLKLPLLLVCEDNQLGISVHSPEGWVETRLRAQPHLAYFKAEAWRLDDCFQTAQAALGWCRQKRLPAVLHLHCRRLLGHAGSDVDTSYRTRAELEEAERLDPLLTAALASIQAGVLSSSQVLELDARAQERVGLAGQLARVSPGIASREQVMAPLVVSWQQPSASGSPPARPKSADRSAPVEASHTLAQGINRALQGLLERHPQAILFGEDVAKKGGVYGITKGLLAKAGPARVFNTLLDEQTILGLALGSATLGLLPIAEIQYLAYLHNAEDQLRGEAATLKFFSNGAYANPMLVRIPGLAYQKGFGGHFHNDHSLAVLRDIPGIIVGVPTRAEDALAMFEQAEQQVLEEGQVVVMIEPIALYHERHLLSETDNRWLSPLQPERTAAGQARVYDPAARDLLLLTYGNGVRLCLRASHELREKHGICARTLDLRWLKPLPIDCVLQHLSEVQRALVVDECRGPGSVSEELVTRLHEASPASKLARVVAPDSFVPLGPAANRVLVSEAEIIAAAKVLVENPAH